MVLQGRQVFEAADLQAALDAVLRHVVARESKTVALTEEELERLSHFKSEYGKRRKKRDPIREARFKELLDQVLALKDSAFAANALGERWSNDMANAAAKMATVLKQLRDEAFPPQVAEYCHSHADQIIGLWQQVYAMVEKALLSEPEA